MTMEVQLILFFFNKKKKTGEINENVCCVDSHNKNTHTHTHMHYEITGRFDNKPHIHRILLSILVKVNGSQGTILIFRRFIRKSRCHGHHMGVLTLKTVVVEFRHEWKEYTYALHMMQ